MGHEQRMGRQAARHRRRTGGRTVVVIVITVLLVGAVGALAVVALSGRESPDATEQAPARDASPTTAQSPSSPQEALADELPAQDQAPAGLVRVTEVRPDVGSMNGGEAIVLAGTGFTEPLAVTIGGRAAVRVDVINDETARVVTPPGLPGPAMIEVTAGGRPQIAVEGVFAYADQPPRVVIAVRPNSGPVAGGTAVTIVGTGFAPGARVVLGGERATEVDVLDDTRIVAVTPSHRVGRVDVVVRNPGAPSAVLAAGFEYVRGPTLSSVAPSELSADGGTLIVLTGTGFDPGATVTVNGRPATAVTVVDDSTIRALAPAGLTGPASVVVTNPGQPSAELRDAVDYVITVPDEPAAVDPPETEPPEVEPSGQPVG